MSEKLLSILIPTVTARAAYLAKLRGEIDPQLTDEVEVLVEKDDGPPTGLQIGTKRNMLVRRAAGKFICFVDDDDLVSIDYVAKLLAAIKSNPDTKVIGIEGTLVVDGQVQFAKPFYHSMRYPTWSENKGTYYRPPNHLNPVLRSIALQVPFKDISFGEDRDYSERLKLMLKPEDEAYVAGSVYLYLFRRRKPEMTQ